MSNFKEAPVNGSNSEELAGKLELQAQVLVAAYAELFKRQRSFLSFGIKDQKLRELSDLFTNAHWQKSNAEQAKILRTDPLFKNKSYFQLQASLLENHLIEDTRAGDFFVLDRKSNGYFYFKSLHHLKQKSFGEKEEEVLGGLTMAVQVKPGFFNRNCFPVQIDYAVFIEIEPGKASENFSLIFGQDQQNFNLRVFCACLAAYDFHPKRTLEKPDEFWFRDKTAFCFIRPNPQTQEIGQAYVFQPPLIVFDKGTNFEELYGDLINLRFPSPNLP